MTTLKELLKDCEALLKGVGEEFWSDKIEAALQHAEATDGVLSASYILTWFGGPGSFNDLTLSEFNGHKIGSKGESELNSTLQDLQSQIYDKAMRMQREE